MPQNFISGDVDQSFLLPPDVREWLPEDHLAWCVRDVVSEVDLSAFRGAYRADGHGAAAFDPALMVAVFCYAYAIGVRSSRAIEACCEQDVAFRVLAANQRPDHATIARFRARHEKALAGLFSEVLRLCHEAGMVRLGQVAVDGTKIAANASWSRNYTEDALAHQLDEAQAAFDAQAAALLAEHAANDAAQDALFGSQRGDELPAPLRRKGERLDRIREAKKRLTAQRESKQAAQDEKVAAWAQRKAEGKRSGRRPGATPPKSGTGKPPRSNRTDPDSRAMRCQHSLLQGYNAQAAVTDDQLIVGADLTQAAVDQGLLHDVLDVTRRQLTAAGIGPALSTVLADAGYANEADFARGETDGLTILAPIIADEDHHREGDPAGGRDLTRYPATDRAQERLRTDAGRAAYAHRGRTVEPVFGQIKEQQRFRRFSRRGLTACRAEWMLGCTAHNLLKLHRRRLVTS